MGLGSEIRDPEKPLPDPGSWIQGSKRHRIADPDPQHCIKHGTSFYLCEEPFTFLVKKLKQLSFDWGSKLHLTEGLYCIWLREYSVWMREYSSFDWESFLCRNGPRKPGTSRHMSMKGKHNNWAVTWFLSNPDPGSNNSTKRGEGKCCCPTIFCSHKYHKIVNNFIFEQVKIIFFIAKTLRIIFIRLG